MQSRTSSVALGLLLLCGCSSQPAEPDARGPQDASQPDPDATDADPPQPAEPEADDAPPQASLDEVEFAVSLTVKDVAQLLQRSRDERPQSESGATWVRVGEVEDLSSRSLTGLDDLFQRLLGESAAFELAPSAEQPALVASLDVGGRNGERSACLRLTDPTTGRVVAVALQRNAAGRGDEGDVADAFQDLSRKLGRKAARGWPRLVPLVGQGYPRPALRLRIDDPSRRDLALEVFSRAELVHLLGGPRELGGAEPSEPLEAGLALTLSVEEEGGARTITAAVLDLGAQKPFVQSQLRISRR